MQYDHKGTNVLWLLIFLFIGCAPPKGCHEPEVPKKEGSLPGRPGPVSHILL